MLISSRVKEELGNNLVFAVTNHCNRNSEMMDDIINDIDISSLNGNVFIRSNTRVGKKVNIVESVKTVNIRLKYLRLDDECALLTEEDMDELCKVGGNRCGNICYK